MAESAKQTQTQKRVNLTGARFGFVLNRAFAVQGSCRTGAAIERRIINARLLRALEEIGETLNCVIQDFERKLSCALAEMGMIFIFKDI